jgi:hypothetical protein
VVTTYAQGRRRGDRLARDLFDMELRAATRSRGRPAIDVFDQFRHRAGTENAIPEANFLALDGERLVGVSRVGRPRGARSAESGLHRHRSRLSGPRIALAAQAARSTTPRRTASARSGPWNDTSNVPMLRINERLGFQRQPPIILYERT